MSSPGYGTSSRWDDDGHAAAGETPGVMPAQSPQVLTANPSREPHVSDARIWGWFFFLSSLFWPRVVILTFWIFGSTIGRAFDSSIVPVLGFFLLPWTTMTYAFMWAISSDRVSGWEWIPVGLALLIDLWTWAGGRHLLAR
jgi:hypothetical protein